MLFISFLPHSVRPGLAVAQLLIIPPLVAASMAMLRPIREKFIAARRDGDRVSAMLTGNVSGMATIGTVAIGNPDTSKYTNFLVHLEP